VDAEALFRTAIAHRQRQDVEAAVEAIDCAARLAPDNSHIAAVRAHLHFESWRAASELFARAATLNPNELQLLRNHALALVAEGDAGAGQALLEQQLDKSPAWIEGHNILARIRLTAGESDGHDRSFAEACASHADSLPLRLAWFYHAAILKDWHKVRQIVDDAERDFPGQRALLSARLYLASECGDDSNIHNMLESVAAMADPGLDLCRTRLHLRKGDVDAAEICAGRHLGTPAENMFWPYLSLIWRLTENPRSDWLNGQPPYSTIFDLDFSHAEIAELAATLRKLHILQAPYPEQSVRGGTQTDRPLFFNPDPVIQSARQKITAAVRKYVHALPAPDPKHPLLSPRRDQILFEGSWSVRLAGKGFHAAHTHVMGWISSAFYVSLPDEPGATPAGWLGLGTPPPELGLNLDPQAMVEPKPGRLVLFPSTMWHSTFPFDAGERLTVAFDIKRP
jgi:Tfp pilus assembly protein PilF